MSLLSLFAFGEATRLHESVGVVINTGQESSDSAEDDQNFTRVGLKRVSSLKLLPSRVMSRAYGAFSHVTLPVAARPVVYGLWSWMFKVKLDEADCASLEDFRHLTEFFTRRLKPGARRVDDRRHVLASPVDGAVVSLSCDLSARGVLKQVKGIDYHVCDFLGLDSRPELRAAKGGLGPVPGTPGGAGAGMQGGSGAGAGADTASEDAVIGSGGTALFSAVLYLAPGDYHAFHSPTEWSATTRAHIAGQLLPVNPAVVKVIPSLFCANERVALVGSWKPARPAPLRSAECELPVPVEQATASPVVEVEGAAAGTGSGVQAQAGAGAGTGASEGQDRPSMFFSYTAVGATNVGSIRLACEPSLVTNTYKHDWACSFSPGDVAAAAGVPMSNPVSQLPKAVMAGAASFRTPPTTPVRPSAAGAEPQQAAPLPPSSPLTTTSAPSPLVLPSRQKHIRQYDKPVHFSRGDGVGVFELGSTVVLVFEAPVDFKWTIREGDKVRMGQALGHLPALRCTCNACACAPSDAFSPAPGTPYTPSPYSPTATPTRLRGVPSAMSAAGLWVAAGSEDSSHSSDDGYGSTASTDCSEGEGAGPTGAGNGGACRTGGTSPRKAVQLGLDLSHIA